jgi:hypothetical protein
LFPFYLAPPSVIAPCTEASPADATPPRSAGGESAVVWADVDRAREPAVAVSFEWAVLQLIPSPELGFGADGALFGLRWQLTPLLYSFATDARLSRWRWFIAEPIVRHSGSLELFASPEYLSLDGGVAGRFGAQLGVRSYFGLLGRGDNLSVSLGGSYHHFAAAKGVSFEAGAYVLFGSLGLVLTYSPEFEAARWVTTLRLRYF